MKKKARIIAVKCGLNESPSEKEGKYDSRRSPAGFPDLASMKVPPKRKGNDTAAFINHQAGEEPQ